MDAIETAKGWLNPLPWYDGDVQGETRVWDANDQEVDLSRYTAIIVSAVNACPADSRRRMAARLLAEALARKPCGYKDDYTPIRDCGFGACARCAALAEFEKAAGDGH